MRDLKQRSLNEWLVIRSQQGEKSAFNELIKNWEQRYYLYALNRLRDKEAARDATQDCLLSISRSLNKLKDPAAYPKWSFLILERRCIDWLRKVIREREVIEHPQELPEIAVRDNTDSELDVEQLLAKLDSRLAAILRLYYLESFSVNEIAQIKNLPSGTVKSRLFYARKLLAKALEE